ncbi:MAG: cytochrome c biogenesis protein ResB [Chloroflexota bacterium]|nr:MAG: cytochrome c biogenesis protein ResB [Chloroflexota bacterium]
MDRKSRKLPLGGAGASSSGAGVQTIAPAGSFDLSALSDAIWHLCCSIRLALILILLIAVAAFVGTLLLQAPGGLSAQDHAVWLDQARLKYGAWTNLLNALQFFEVFSSVWFRGLLVLLMINVTACTVNRWPAMWISISRPRVRTGDGFFRQSATGTCIDASGLSMSEAAESLRSLLAGRRFRVLTERTERAVHLYADRNRYGKLGTFLNHASLLLLMAGVIIGSVFGFRNTEFVIPEGSVRDVGFGTNLSVKCESFIDEYYPDGPPKDYRSDLVIYENGAEVKRQTVRVNEPLDYKGVRFHQAFFGPAAIIEAKDEAGQRLFHDGVALAYESAQRPVGSFVIPERGLMVVVVGPMSGRQDSLVGPGEVRLEVYQELTQTRVASDNLSLRESKTLAGLSFTFERERQFTGLQVVRDPGVTLIWIASALMVIGLIMVFYFPHRRLWARCQPGADGQTEIWMAAITRRDLPFAREFQFLTNEVRERLGIGRRVPDV